MFKPGNFTLTRRWFRQNFHRYKFNFGFRKNNNESVLTNGILSVETMHRCSSTLNISIEFDAFSYQQSFVEVLTFFFISSVSNELDKVKIHPCGYFRVTNRTDGIKIFAGRFAFEWSRITDLLPDPSSSLNQPCSSIINQFYIFVAGETEF